MLVTENKLEDTVYFTLVLYKGLKYIKDFKTVSVNGESRYDINIGTSGITLTPKYEIKGSNILFSNFVINLAKNKSGVIGLRIDNKVRKLYSSYKFNDTLVLVIKFLYGSGYFELPLDGIKLVLDILELSKNLEPKEFEIVK